MKKRVAFLILVVVLALIIFFALQSVFAGSTVVSPGTSVFGLQLNWYSLFIFIGAVFALLWTARRASDAGITRSEAENLVLLCVLTGLLGARLHHVLSQWTYYNANRLEMFYFWHGGLGIYGGVGMGVLAVWFFAKWKKVSFFGLADMLAPALVFGQALGRWGNFFNYEAYGVATDLPWKMFVPLQHRILGTEGVQYAHPLFLYESLWDLLIFLFLWRAGNFPRKRPGIIFGLYLLFYSMGRFFFEMLRADVTVAFGLRVNMILSLVVFVFGFLVLFRPADKNEINLKIVV